MCVVDGRELLASASNDRTVRIWDPGTGVTERTLDGHTSGVRGVCAVRVGSGFDPGVPTVRS